MGRKKKSKRHVRSVRRKAGKIAAAKRTGKPQVLRIVKKRAGTITSLKRDRKRSAMPPGWRVSKRGNVYYEVRKNRSDMPGSKI